MKRFFSTGLFFFITFVFLITIFIPEMIEKGELNVRAIESSQSLMFDNNKSLTNSIGSFENQDKNCHQLWLSWVELFYSSNGLENEKITLELLNCSVENVNLVKKFFPSNLKLAQLSIDLYPENPSALYWVYENLPQGEYYQIQVILEKIVEISPFDGFAWSRLAYAYESQLNFDSALQAFINACTYGDFGNHGCYGAGRLYEKQGSIDLAIIYYNQSKWLTSRQQAERLKNSIEP